MLLCKVKRRIFKGLSQSEDQYTSTEPLSLEFPKLIGEGLILEPLSRAHTKELIEIIDLQIWKWYTLKIKSPEDMSAYVDRHLADQEREFSQTYVVRLKETGEVVGSSRFLNIDKGNRRVEIGSTWYHPKWQRTFVNTECKFLLLRHAFEGLRCVCVQFQTDSLNERSRRAIERIGAQQDGILRNHRICEDGRIRHSVFFSIGMSEWERVKSQLLVLMGRGPR
jgi:RimJ/RimL family protein N-acetyltransferase